MVCCRWVPRHPPEMPAALSRPRTCDSPTASPHCRRLAACLCLCVALLWLWLWLWLWLCAPEPQVGQMVEVAYTALVWDGATTRASEVSSASTHVFQLGDRSLVPVPPGLHAALAELCVGQSATVVLDPDAG